MKDKIHIKSFNEHQENLNISDVRHRLNEDVYEQSEGEKTADRFGIRNFKIEEVEIISEKPIYRIWGRISGDLCYFEIDGNISDVSDDV